MINHAIQTDVRKRSLDTPAQKRILQSLAALADEHGEVNQSLPDIAFRAKACRRTVIQVLHELAAQEEILILNAPRRRGHYRINHLPTEEKPPIDSFRTPIVEAIRLLPLPTRVSAIYQALAQYASRSGNNMFPSVKTLMRDTAYSQSTIQETLRWLVKANFIAPDRDCVTPTYQSRIGYKIPGWNFLAQILTIDEEQIEQIKTLYDHHNRHYWERKVDREGNQIQPGQTQQDQEEEEASWLEEHAFDFNEYTPGASTWPDEEESEDELEEDQPGTSTWLDEEGEEEELGDEESARAAEDGSVALDDPQSEELAGAEERETGREDRIAAPHYVQGEEERTGTRSSLLEESAAGLSGSSSEQSLSHPMSPPSERLRVVLAPERRKTGVSLRSYQTAQAAMEPHRRIIEEHESGRHVVDEATLKKAEQIVRFYERTIAAYEAQCERRE